MGFAMPLLPNLFIGITLGETLHWRKNAAYPYNHADKYRPAIGTKFHSLDHLSVSPVSFFFVPYHVALYNITLNFTLPYASFYCITFYYDTLRYIKSHQVVLREVYTSLHYKTSQQVTLQCFIYTTLHHRTLQYVTLHHTKLHYIILSYITSNYYIMVHYQT